MTHTYTTSMTYYSTFTGQSDCKFGILKSKIDDYKYYGLGNFFLLWNSDDDCQLEIDGKNDKMYWCTMENKDSGYEAWIESFSFTDTKA